MPQLLIHTLPLSRKATTPKLPRIVARASDENSNMLLPPTGRPPTSGLSSYRPHPRTLVEPPRKNFREKGTAVGSEAGAEMLPSCARLAHEKRSPIGR